MKKLMLIVLGAATFSVVSCTKSEKTETDTAVVTESTTGAENDELYRQRSQEVADRMARDLKFENDTAMQRKVSTVYYSRATRRSQTRGKYATDTTGMAAEYRDIDLDVDQRFRDMLRPDQYSIYETNRTTYYGGFEEVDTPSSGYDSSGSNSASAAGSSGSSSGSGSTQYPPGTTVKTKTDKDGDTKIEIEGPNGQTKIKRDADGETKIKTKNSN